MANLQKSTRLPNVRLENVSLRVPILDEHLNNTQRTEGPCQTVHDVSISIDLHCNSNDGEAVRNQARDSVAKICEEVVSSRPVFEPLEVVEDIARTLDSALSKLVPSNIEVTAKFDKVCLNSKSASVSFSTLGEISFFLQETRVAPSFSKEGGDGRYPIYLTITCSYENSVPSRPFQFTALELMIAEFSYSTAYPNFESFLASSCVRILTWLGDRGATVSLKATRIARSLADESTITIIRSFTDLSENEITLYSKIGHTSLDFSTTEDGKTLACVALGSNLGDRFQNIELALRYLDEYTYAFDSANELGGIVGELAVIDTSFLYETAPMYVTEQPSFINCACLVETTLPPQDLLRVLKQIEKAVGRVPSIRNGPRAVDLDIITYGTQIVDTRPEKERWNFNNLEDQLVIPHPRMAEREFVLRPLNDIIPAWNHPLFHMSVSSMLKAVLLNKRPGDPPMHKVIPFATGNAAKAKISVPPTQTYWTVPDPHQDAEKYPRRTFVMATLNVTPDSFSDGLAHFDPEDALAYVRESIENGADIIDIGGYSTRPGATFVTTEEEIRRVVPVIRAIRENTDFGSVLISVDTFRHEVAKAAIEAGANCINDVYAFSGPEYPATSATPKHFEKMRQLARESAVPVILMHSRGDASANKDYSMYESKGEIEGSSAVLEGVRIELGDKVDRAIRGKGGIRRWNVIVDPGIGFSKSVADNLALVRRASELTAGANEPLSLSNAKKNLLAGFPLLIGTSRKSYLGLILSESTPPKNPSEVTVVHKPKARIAKERDFATAAAVACAVQQGAAIVRVHEVQGMADAVKVATALWS